MSSSTTESPSTAPSTTDDDKPIVVAWTGIWVTLIISLAQGAIFYAFFLRQRGKDRQRYLQDNPSHSSCVDPEAAKRVFDIYESRQHTRSYRSPPPFGLESSSGSSSNGSNSNNRNGRATITSSSASTLDSNHNSTQNSGTGTSTHHTPRSWWSAAWSVSDSELLRCVGLDAYMFLRVLRLGARLAGFGSLLSLILMPVYATGPVRDTPSTEQFNLLTLVRVENGSSPDNWRLYVTVACWYAFCAFCLYELYTEWQSYAQHYCHFVARGDLDTPVTARYAVRVEQVALHDNTDRHVHDYFERLFPRKVFQATSVVATTALEKLMAERQAKILKLEAVVAKQHAAALKRGNQNRSSSTGTSTNNEIQMTVKGVKVSAVHHYESEIAHLNSAIDKVRREILTGMGTPPQQNASQRQRPPPTTSTTPVRNKQGFDDGIEVNMTSGSGGDSGDDNNASGLSSSPLPVESSSTSLAQRTTTAFVTFTSLRAKQAALQCALTDNPDKMKVFAAFDPASTLWQNAHVPRPQQVYLQAMASVLFTIGILFWTFPMAGVALFSNLNSVLKWFDTSADPTTAWYGLVSGLLPVVALAVLMFVLYKVITMAATTFIRLKTWPEVDSYCLFWHMLFQFANLWFIVIGGSLFADIQELTSDMPWSIFDTVAKVMPGQAIFFINMILLSSFGAFGLELSMIPKHAITFIMGLLSPEAARTQRQLDSGQKPPSIVWGQTMPPIVFIFLVSFVYMSIVPVVEIFSFVFFSGMYMVWKHQCLHVYAQEFEGGGDATWQKVFVFLMASLYIGEVLFVGFMGLKEAPIHSGLGLVPLIVTILFHRHLVRKVIVPLRYLSLEVAADVDLQDGELNSTNNSTSTPLFRQPALDPDQEERGPMPYRRNMETNHRVGGGTTV